MNVADRPVATVVVAREALKASPEAPWIFLGCHTYAAYWRYTIGKLATYVVGAS